MFTGTERLLLLEWGPVLLPQVGWNTPRSTSQAVMRRVRY